LFGIDWSKRLRILQQQVVEENFRLCSQPRCEKQVPLTCFIAVLTGPQAAPRLIPEIQPSTGASQMSSRQPRKIQRHEIHLREKRIERKSEVRRLKALQEKLDLIANTRQPMLRAC
jgi:hypothetical protein